TFQNRTAAPIVTSPRVGSSVAGEPAKTPMSCWQFPAAASSSAGSGRGGAVARSWEGGGGGSPFGGLVAATTTFAPGRIAWSLAAAKTCRIVARLPKVWARRTILLAVGTLTTTRIPIRDRRIRSSTRLNPVGNALRVRAGRCWSNSFSEYPDSGLRLV